MYYIIFSKEGTPLHEELTSQIVQGSYNVDTIFVGFEDETFSPYNYLADLVFERSDLQTSPKISMTVASFEYNGKNYIGYKKTLDTNWYTAVSGVLKITVSVKDFENEDILSNKAFGIFNVTIQKAVNADENNYITSEQYNSLLDLVNSKLDKLDEKVYKFESHNDYNSFLNDAILKYQELGFKIFFTIINNNSVIGLLSPNTKSMIVINSKNEMYYIDNFITKGISLTNPTLNNINVEGLTNYLNGTLLLKTNASIDALGGSVIVKTPSNPNDAVNKQYVDETGGLIKDYIDGKVITLDRKIDTTKSELIGTDQDAYNIDTIKGSKKYADKVKNDVTEKYDSSIKNVTQSYNDDTGVITLTYTRQDNTTFNVNINTPAEKILDLNNPPRMEGNNLVLTFVDGTSVSIDMSQFVTLYFGSESDTIDVEIDPLTNTITAKIKINGIRTKNPTNNFQIKASNNSTTVTVNAIINALTSDKLFANFL